MAVLVELQRRRWIEVTAIGQVLCDAVHGFFNKIRKASELSQNAELSVIFDDLRKLEKCVLIEHSKPHTAERATLYGLLDHKNDSSILCQLCILHIGLWDRAKL